MNKKIFLPGIALFALLSFSCSLEAVPPLLKNEQLRAILRTLREPRAMAGIGIGSSIIILCIAGYKFLNRASATARGAEELTTHATATVNRLGQLLNPELLKNKEYRDIIVSMLSEVTSTAIKTYLTTNAELAAKNTPQGPSSIITLIENKAFQQLIKDIAELVTKTYIETKAAVDAASAASAAPAAPTTPLWQQIIDYLGAKPQLLTSLGTSLEKIISAATKAYVRAQPVPPANQPTAITQVFSAAAANPQVVATAVFNAASGYAARPQAPTVLQAASAQQSRQWFWQRWWLSLKWTTL